jgi:hypothetical protein
MTTGHLVLDAIEPAAAPINNDTALVSIAISLKRIADCLEAPEPKNSANINHLLWDILQQLGSQP